MYAVRRNKAEEKKRDPEHPHFEHEKKGEAHTNAATSTVEQLHQQEEQQRQRRDRAPGKKSDMTNTRAAGKGEAT